MSTDPSAKIARWLSLLTSPFVTISIFSLWIIAVYAPSWTLFAEWAALFLFFIIILPFGYIAQQVRSGKITDLHVMLREQRAKPFVIATISSLFLLAIYHYLQVPSALASLALVLFLNGVLFLFITSFWKISVHVAAFVGSVLCVGILVNFYFTLLLAFLPLVIWARLKRQRHTITQTLASAALVAALTWITLHL